MQKVSYKYFPGFEELKKSKNETVKEDFKKHEKVAKAKMWAGISNTTQKISATLSVISAVSVILPMAFFIVENLNAFYISLIIVAIFFTSSFISFAINAYINYKSRKNIQKNKNSISDFEKYYKEIRSLKTVKGKETEIQLKKETLFKDLFLYYDKLEENSRNVAQSKVFKDSVFKDSVFKDFLKDIKNDSTLFKILIEQYFKHLNTLTINDNDKYLNLLKKYLKHIDKLFPQNKDKFLINENIQSHINNLCNIKSSSLIINIIKEYLSHSALLNYETLRILTKKLFLLVFNPLVRNSNKGLLKSACEKLFSISLNSYFLKKPTTKLFNAEENSEIFLASLELWLQLIKNIGLKTEDNKIILREFLPFPKNNNYKNFEKIISTLKIGIGNKDQLYKGLEEVLKLTPALNIGLQQCYSTFAKIILKLLERIGLNSLDFPKIRKILITIAIINRNLEIFSVINIEKFLTEEFLKISEISFKEIVEIAAKNASFINKIKELTKLKNDPISYIIICLELLRTNFSTDNCIRERENKKIFEAIFNFSKKYFSKKYELEKLKDIFLPLKNRFKKENLKIISKDLLQLYSSENNPKKEELYLSLASFFLEIYEVKINKFHWRHPSSKNWCFEIIQILRKNHSNEQSINMRDMQRDMQILQFLQAAVYFNSNPLDRSSNLAMIFIKKATKLNEKKYKKELDTIINFFEKNLNTKKGQKILDNILKEIYKKKTPYNEIITKFINIKK